MTNPFRHLTKFELSLWLISAAVILSSALISGGQDRLSCAASLVGVTALIFVAKGYVLGQLLTVVFALMYGIVSRDCRYYGEMITYMGMTAPIAAATAVNWLRHPYKGSREVTVSRLTKRTAAGLSAGTLLVTALFYFILKALGTASLPLSTVSVATSFIASALTLCRSPGYALGYAANDLVLIGLWTVQLGKDEGALSMCLCFMMFLINDLYGFYNWRRMLQRQQAG